MTGRQIRHSCCPRLLANAFSRVRISKRKPYHSSLWFGMGSFKPIVVLHTPCFPKPIREPGETLLLLCNLASLVTSRLARRHQARGCKFSFWLFNPWSFNFFCRAVSGRGEPGLTVFWIFVLLYFAPRLFFSFSFSFCFERR